MGFPGQVGSLDAIPALFKPEQDLEWRTHLSGELAKTMARLVGALGLALCLIVSVQAENSVRQMVSNSFIV